MSEAEALEDMYAGSDEDLAATSGKCPECDADLVLRENRRTGDEFWGCSNYPKCKWSMSA